MSDNMGIPAWAEKALDRTPAKPVDATELILLREFHAVWKALHAIPRDKMHRRQQEEAAVKLTIAAEAVENYRSPAQLHRMLTAPQSPPPSAETVGAIIRGAAAMRDGRGT